MVATHSFPFGHQVLPFRSLQWHQDIVIILRLRRQVDIALVLRRRASQRLPLHRWRRHRRLNHSKTQEKKVKLNENQKTRRPMFDNQGRAKSPLIHRRATSLDGKVSPWCIKSPVIHCHAFILRAQLSSHLPLRP